MSRYYRERISHRDYLNNMKKNTEAIINQYQVFRSELMIKSDDLQKFLFNSKNFNLLFNYAINERKNIQLLRIKDQLEKKREQAGFDMFPQNIHHEIIVMKQSYRIGQCKVDVFGERRDYKEVHSAV